MFVNRDAKLREFICKKKKKKPSRTTVFFIWESLLVAITCLFPCGLATVAASTTLEVRTLLSKSYINLSGGESYDFPHGERSSFACNKLQHILSIFPKVVATIPHFWENVGRTLLVPH